MELVSGKYIRLSTEHPLQLEDLLWDLQRCPEISCQLMSFVACFKCYKCGYQAVPGLHTLTPEEDEMLSKHFSTISE